MDFKGVERVGFARCTDGGHKAIHVNRWEEYYIDIIHILNEEPLVLQTDLTYVDRPIRAFEESVKRLRNR
jgi:hypothetical protein